MNIPSIHQYSFILTTSELFCHHFFESHSCTCLYSNVYAINTNIDNHGIMFAYNKLQIISFPVIPVTYLLQKFVFCILRTIFMELPIFNSSAIKNPCVNLFPALSSSGSTLSRTFCLLLSYMPRLALSIANFAIGATNFSLAKLF